MRNKPSVKTELSHEKIAHDKRFNGGLFVALNLLVFVLSVVEGVIQFSGLGFKKGVNFCLSYP